jgi:hypothetical protein
VPALGRSSTAQPRGRRRRRSCSARSSARCSTRRSHTRLRRGPQGTAAPRRTRPRTLARMQTASARRHAKCAELTADVAEFTLDASHVVARQEKRHRGRAARKQNRPRCILIRSGRARTRVDRDVRPRLMRRARQPRESLRRGLRMHGVAAARFSQAVHARGVHAHAAVSGALPPSAGLPLAARRTGRRRRRRDRPFAATVARR